MGCPLRDRQLRYLDATYHKIFTIGPKFATDIIIASAKALVKEKKTGFT